MQLITELSPWWIIGCILLGAGYAYVLYGSTASGTFSKTVQRLLAFFRALVVAFLAFLLLSPLIRTVSREKEKPLVLVALDNSESLLQGDSTAFLASFPAAAGKFSERLKEKYDVRVLNWSDKVEEGTPLDFSGQQTDFSTLFAEVNTRYANRNVGALVIASDGLYNRGNNPVYEPFDLRAPVYTVALGDTIVRKDLLISSVNHNKTVYLGNVFPLDVKIEARQFSGSVFSLTVEQDSAILFRRMITASGPRYRLSVPVLLDAKKKGWMRLRVRLSVLDGEITEANNQREIFIEVRESKEKILILANAPHPDIGAMVELLESSQNYDVRFERAADFSGKPDGENLLILHNLPSSEQDASDVYAAFHQAGIPVMFVLGTQTSIPQFNQLGSGLTISTGTPGKTNFVQPTLNPGFSLFTLDDKLKDRVGTLTPLLAPFGNYQTSGTPSVLFYQQIGSVKSSEPLLVFTQQDRSKNGFLCGEGIWRWPMLEFASFGEKAAVREFFIKTVQYLSVRDDRSKFRIIAKNSYAENEPVIFDAEVFNDNYELINTPDIALDLMDSENRKYPFVFSKTDRAYSLNAGYLAPGNYRFTASYEAGGKRTVSSGAFSVYPIQAEQSETVADHQLLASLAVAKGGKMMFPSQLDQLAEELLSNKDIKTISYSQVRLQDLINLKLVFFILLILLSGEWFIRKRSGSY